MKQNKDPLNSFTVTTYNLTSFRKYSNISLNLTHVARDNDCFTAIRTGDIISHKCYGGNG